MGRDRPGRQRRLGDNGPLKPVPFGEQFGGIALPLAESLDLNRNGLQSVLDALEARVLIERIPSFLGPRASEPLSPAVDGGPKCDRSGQRAADQDGGLIVDHRVLQEWCASPYASESQTFRRAYVRANEDVE